MKATLAGGKLQPISKCKLIIGGEEIVLNNLPDISNGGSASYNDEAIMGRSSSISTYAHTDKSTVSFKIHLYVTSKDDIKKNIHYYRLIRSALFPRDGSPYIPPPICQISCGALLGNGPLCVILRSCNPTAPREVAWDEENLWPYQLDIDTQWDVVYKTSYLPGQQRILEKGN